MSKHENIGVKFVKVTTTMSKSVQVWVAVILTMVIALVVKELAWTNPEPGWSSPSLMTLTRM